MQIRESIVSSVAIDIDKHDVDVPGHDTIVSPLTEDDVVGALDEFERRSIAEKDHMDTRVFGVDLQGSSVYDDWMEFYLKHKEFSDKNQ